MADKPVYTEEEQRRLEEGLRILARLIARAYARDQARGNTVEPAQGAESQQKEHRNGRGRNKRDRSNEGR